MKNKFLFLLLITSGCCKAQQKTFDLIQYMPLKGWKEERSAEGNIISYDTVNKTSKNWCKINIIKSTVTKGDIDADFKSEWNLFAVDQYKATGLQENEIQETDGWKIKAGGGKFIYNGNDAMVLLTTFSGFGVCASCVIVTNSNDYLRQIDLFIQGLNIIKPAAKAGVASLDNPVAANSNKPVYGFTTSNFDDGWVSTESADYVTVSKSSVKVLLHYTVKYDDDIRNDITNNCWKKLAADRYTVHQFYYPDLRNIYIPVYFLQADVIEKATGNAKFVSFLVESNGGTGNAYEVIADSRAAYEKLFPDYKAVSNMGYYNRFAVAARDIPGSWGSGSTETAQWNYTEAAGGGYAGMSVAATSSEFHFKSDGTYASSHKGATGFVGRMNTYQQEYKGKYFLTNWSLTVTNRFQGKTDIYDAWFECVRGGRILHIQNQQYAGDHEKLVKTK